MKRLLLSGLVLVLGLTLSGCYFANYAVVMDEDNEQGRTFFDVIGSTYSAGEADFSMLEASAREFLPLLDTVYSYEAREYNEGAHGIRFSSRAPAAIEDIPGLSVLDTGDGMVRYEIHVPTLVSDVESYNGQGFAVDLYVNGKPIEANTFDIDEDYEMQIVYAGQRRTRFFWSLAPENLTRPLTLWAVVEPRSVEEPEANTDATSQAGAAQ